jgi:hypothetical protein
LEPSLLTSLVHFTTVAVAGQVLNPRKLVVSVKGCSGGVVLEFSSDARGSNGPIASDEAFVRTEVAAIL